jgi:hypothetical protein
VLKIRSRCDPDFLQDLYPENLTGSVFGFRSDPFLKIERDSVMRFLALGLFKIKTSIIYAPDFPNKKH